MDNISRLKNVIEALGKHKDEQSVEVLERLGMGSNIDYIRSLSAKALIKRNTKNSLEVIINRQGKGINDADMNVAMSAINEILELDEKTNVINILENVSINSSDKSVRDCAKAVRTLIELS